MYLHSLKLNHNSTLPYECVRVLCYIGVPVHDHILQVHLLQGLKQWKQDL